MINAETILRDLESHVFRTVLATHGERTARASARAVFECICLNFRHRAMYVPTVNHADIQARYESIWRDFTGHNQFELSIKYRLSLTRIYIIINEMRSLHVRRRQADLFPLPDEDQDERPLTSIVLEDYLPAELARAGLPTSDAQTVAKSVADKLYGDYHGIQIGGFDHLYKRMMRNDTLDLFDDGEPEAA